MSHRFKVTTIHKGKRIEIATGNSLNALDMVAGTVFFKFGQAKLSPVDPTNKEDWKELY